MKKIILTENQYNFLLKENRSELYSYLESVKDNIAKAAQKVYDNWEQDGFFFRNGNKGFFSDSLIELNNKNK